MKILITGNMGYVGPSVVRRLRSIYPEAELVGFDTGYFGALLTTTTSLLPENLLNVQHFGDVRDFPRELLMGVDAVVYLAALSNDPMGSQYATMTADINCQSAVQMASMAKAQGVGSFIFASSCSTYGFAGEGSRTERSEVNPLTAYACSKVAAEEGLAKLAEERFVVTCLRFATACGMSDRLRLDLVLNDFVASAIACRKISILSDGTPWRPLIHIEDMARGIEWAVSRRVETGGALLVVNVGSNSWNYQVKDLAEAVAAEFPGMIVEINADALPDRRSYRVSFDLYASLAPGHQPAWTLHDTIQDLKRGLEKMGFNDGDFRKSRLMRLQALDALVAAGLLDSSLRWNQPMGVRPNDIN